MATGVVGILVRTCADWMIRCYCDRGDNKSSSMTLCYLLVLLSVSIYELAKAVFTENLMGLSSLVFSHGNF